MCMKNEWKKKRKKENRSKHGTTLIPTALFHAEEQTIGEKYVDTAQRKMQETISYGKSCYDTFESMRRTGAVIEVQQCRGRLPM